MLDDKEIFGMASICHKVVKATQFISQKMGELARLVKRTDGNWWKQAAQLADYIKPDGFDSIVVAIKRINHDGQQPCTLPQT